MTTSARVSSVLTLVLALLAFPASAKPIVFQSTDTPPHWSAVKRFRHSAATYIAGDPDVLLYQKRRAIFPIGIFRSSFFYYKPLHDVIAYRSLRDFRGHTLGVLRGTLDGKEAFERNGVTVEESDSVESLMRKLKKGRIDVCITVTGTARHTIQQLFPGEQDAFVDVVIPALDRPIAIMIDLDDAEGKIIAQRYLRVLESVLNGSEYNAIVEKYYSGEEVLYRKEKLNYFMRYYENTWEN